MKKLRGRSSERETTAKKKTQKPRKKKGPGGTAGEPFRAVERKEVSSSSRTKRMLAGEAGGRPSGKKGNGKVSDGRQPVITRQEGHAKYPAGRARSDRTKKK